MSDNKYSNICKTKDGSYTLLDPDTNEMYHSSEGARFEAWSLYIESSGILSSFNNKDRGKDHNRSTITVLDVGLGLGYNAISTVEAWATTKSYHDLEIISLEIDKDLVELFISTKAEWMKNWDDNLKNIITLFKPISIDTDTRYFLEYTSQSGSKLYWTIIVSDATSDSSIQFPYKNQDKKRSYDFIWQDPFSPSKNPKMWSEEWFIKLKNTTSISTKLMSYSVSGVVKENLKKAGWNYIKIPTPGIKRSWLIATPIF